MKVFIECFWGASGKKPLKFFSFPECWGLVEEYSSRITERGFLTEITSGQSVRKPRSHIWMCHPRGKQLTSLAVSEQFERVKASGCDLVVCIGNDIGFSADQIKTLKPDLLWSFGPLTLPHELATVVACEQLYRGVSILRNEPYHRE